jgi:branched-chain amino acid transport system substrate-binding protein
MGAGKKEQKEVHELKKILYLIMISLLVLGLVLAGCGGTPSEQQEEEEEEEEDLRPAITLGIAGPMAAAQGLHHFWGAELAANEINGSDFTTDGVDVGGTLYKIELVEIDTNEILNPSGADGVTRMEANIDDVDFFLGGFRTEATLAYREVAVGPDGAGKLFIGCGAATEVLQQSVVQDYDNYKYWFKGTPPNELFLTTSLGKLQTAIIAATQAALGDPTWYPKVAYMVENALWTELSRALTVARLGPTGLNFLVGPAPYMWLPSPTAGVAEMNTLLEEIATYDPDIVLLVVSGPCGTTYANRVGAYMPDVLTLGINVDAQRSEFPDVAAYAEGMIFLDMVTPGVEVSATSVDFVSDFEAEYGEAPIYTAGTYDAVLGLVAAIEGTGSLDTDGIIAWMEDVANARVTAGGPGGYYQVWDGSTEGANPLGTGTVPALNEAQVLELYPWLADAKYAVDATTIVDWTYNPDDWVMPPHTTHDQVYGSQWIHGLASQWQDVDGTLQKVCVWPTVLLATAPTTLEAWLGAVGAGAIDAPTMYQAQAAGLWDKYGWWNFAYPGAGSLQLTDWIMWLATK